MLTLELWHSVCLLNDECKRRGEEISRTTIQETLHVAQAEAQHIIWALQNKEIIKFNEPNENVDGKREAIISDLHVPYHDKIAVEKTLQHIEKFKPDYLTILGDALDFYKLSRFTKNPQKKDADKEIIELKNILFDLRKRFPKTKILYKEGNHEHHLERYICESAPAIYNIIPKLLQNALELNSLKIKYIYKPFRVGKLWHLHGHEKPGGSYNPEHIVNVMWGFIHKHFIVGHYHRNQEKIFSDIEGEKWWGGAVGYLAGKLDYALLNKWSQGFCEIEYFKNGTFKPHLYSVVNGEIF